jgi:hypothetical protein
MVLPASGRSAGQAVVVPDGYTCDVRVESYGLDQQGRRRTDLPVRGRARVSGADARVDIVSGDGGSYRPGDWILTTSEGRALYIVHPASRTYVEIDLARAGRDMARDKFIHASIDSLTVQADSLGTCDTIEGHVTRCFEVTATYMLTVRYFLLRHTSRVQERVRYWVRPDLPTLPNPAGLFLQSSSQLSVVGDRAVVDRLRRVHGRLFAGTAVRMEQVQTELDGTRVTATEGTRVELTRLRLAPNPSATFELPPGYRPVAE